MPDEGVGSEMTPIAAPVEERIPCLVMSHGLDSINIESLRSIMTCDARLQVDVIHNPWPHEEGAFNSLCLGAMREGRINSYTSLDRNISNNAIHMALTRTRERYLAARYMIVTDCDVVAPAGLVSEQVGILERRLELFAVGLRVDPSAWPDSNPAKGVLERRFGAPSNLRDDHIVCGTGMWMVMFRTSELYQVFDLANANRLRFVDANLKRLASLALGKEWAATRRSVGRELNRESGDYEWRRSISMSAFGAYSPEPAGDKYAAWNHNLTSGGHVHLGSGSSRVEPVELVEALPRFRGSLEEDRLLRIIMAGGQHLSVTASQSFQPDQPGLQIILDQGSPVQSLTGLPGGRMVLHLGPIDAVGRQFPILNRVDVGSLMNHAESRFIKAWLGALVRLLTDGGVITGDMSDPTFHPQAWSQRGFEKTAAAKGWEIAVSASPDGRRKFCLSRA